MMKQIEAFVQSDKLRAVVDAIEKKKVGGISVIQARGRGKGHRPEVGGERGTSRHTAEYASLDEVLVVVEDADADAVETAILNAASTGSKGDGKIFVTPVEKAIDIGTKSTGESAL
ncbi:P-II family nitrogen regulator [Nitrosopumilus sp.]|uniref:P-II family nitrogen regulator n=1 Tax=Nitrosopumilus sp. TaxID=2024843 RepID=UPI003B5964A5